MEAAAGNFSEQRLDSNVAFTQDVDIAETSPSLSEASVVSSLEDL